MYRALCYRNIEIPNIFQARRERNRQAQQSTRKVRGLRVAERDAEIDRLHGIIDDLTGLFIKSSQSPFQHEAVRSNRAITRDVAQITREFLDKAREADRPQDQHKVDEPQPQANLTQSSPKEIGNIVDTTLMPAAICESRHTSQLHVGHGLWTPRLTYGALLTPRVDRSCGNCRDIEYEIRYGQDSFAARLMYVTVVFAQEEIARGDGPLPAPAPLMFRLTWKYEPIEWTKRRNLEAFQRLHCLLPPAEGEQAAIDAEHTAHIAECCRRDTLAFSDTYGRALNIFEVEDYLRQTWAIQVDPIFAKARHVQVLANGRAGISTSIIHDLSPFFSRLATACLCFGDGPRYPTRFLDQCMRAVLRQSKEL